MTMHDSSQDAHLVAEALLDAEAFKVSLDPLFTWTSGIKSPVYCDLRVLNSFVEQRRLIVEALAAMVPDTAEVIAGTATAGISWGAWVAEKKGLPFVYIRKKAKEHGAKKAVEGHVEEGQNVVLVEDLISTGGSSIRAVEILRDECGAVVDTVVAINTYMMAKADLAFAKADANLFTVTSSPLIFNVARQRGVITPQEELMLQEFGKDPAAWAKEHGLG